MNDKKKLILIIGIVFVLCIGIAVTLNKRDESHPQMYVPEVKELPLRVDTVPVEFNIVNEQGINFMDCSYENKSSVDIMNFVLEVSFKDTNEQKSITFNNLVKAGETSEIVKINAPASANKDDVEILKYKISTTDGVYMEYDVKLNQYNWS